MHPRRFAFIGGMLMIIMGVAALVPSLSTDTGLLPLNLDDSYGVFLGIFPMNIINKLVLIALGLTGIICATAKNISLPMSIKFSRVIVAVMAVATLLGMLPWTQTVFGYWPLFGGEIWFHGLLTILGVYFGWTLTAKLPDMSPPAKPFGAPLMR